MQTLFDDKFEGTDKYFFSLNFKIFPSYINTGNKFAYLHKKNEWHLFLQDTFKICALWSCLKTFLILLY